MLAQLREQKGGEVEGRGDRGPLEDLKAVQGSNMQGGGHGEQERPRKTPPIKPQHQQRALTGDLILPKQFCDLGPS